MTSTRPSDMTTLHEAAQMALDALETLCAEPNDTRPRTNPFTTITALRSALAAPEPESSVDDMPGMWEPSDTFGGEADNAAPPAAPASQWMPIETAPKDGALFLCWVDAVRYGETDEGQQYEEDVSQLDFCYWRTQADIPDCGWFDPCCGQIGDQQRVTHWMPLPAAPDHLRDTTEKVAPAQPVPLTDEWIAQFFMQLPLSYEQVEKIVRHVERAHGITGGGK